MTPTLVIPAPPVDPVKLRQRCFTLDPTPTPLYLQDAVGKLDQFAKEVFAEETPAITHGGVAWQPPSEINLSEVRLDGMLLVHDPTRLLDLPAPWSEARLHDEIVLEVKMPGDHVDLLATDRALLRRQARQVQRTESSKSPPRWEGEVPLWVVAPHMPEILRRSRTLEPIAPGCYRVGPAWFSFLWISANELPLREDLIPFLIARSGRALNELAFWIKTRKPREWMMRMLESLPMSPAEFEDVLRYLGQKTDDPETREKRLRMGQIMFPDLVEEARAQAAVPVLAHQVERRLARSLTDDEHHALREALSRVGANRLGDVVLDLTPEALAAWLADPNAQ